MHNTITYIYIIRKINKPKLINMKKYRAELVVFEGGETNEEVMDLINVEDESDKLMAAPDEFKVGEIVSDDEIEMREASVVDEDGNYNGCTLIAFKINS